MEDGMMDYIPCNPKLDMPRSSLKVKHPTSGVYGYRVGIEVFHQLHCINLLQRVTYKE